MSAPPYLCRPTGGDFLLTVAILGLSAWSLAPLSHGLAGGRGTATVYQEGRPIHRLDLGEDRRVDIAGGRMTLEVKAGRVRVLQSGCLGQVCVRMGWASRAPQALVCAPYQVVVAVSGGKPADGQDPDVDAVSR